MIKANFKDEDSLNKKLDIYKANCNDCDRIFTDNVDFFLLDIDSNAI